MTTPLQLPILIRWPNDESGGYFRVPGYLVSESTALAIFDEHLEVHLVEATPDPDEYDLRYASNPMFYVGDDLPTIFYDLRTLTMSEFACKYTHSDFYMPASVSG
jgi:hypothetical protein